MTASTATAIPSPSIYVSILADYNAGIHHGAWITLEKGVAYARKAICRLLSTSPTARQEGRKAEEWAFTRMKALKTSISPSMKTLKS